MCYDRLKFAEQASPATDDDILELRRATGGGPSNQPYVSFLKMHNGGVLCPEAISSEPLLIYPIITFLSVSSILIELKEIPELGENGIFPIAYDKGLRLLCIESLIENTQVYVLEIDRMYNVSPTQVFTVCRTVEEFFDSLSQVSPEVDLATSIASQSWNVVLNKYSIQQLQSIKAANGNSVLCEAMRLENDELVKALIESNFDHSGAMEIAVTNRRLDYVQLLLKHGIDPGDGIDFAVGYSRREIRNLLQAENERRKNGSVNSG